MRINIMEYHRHFIEAREAREARRQAEYDQIGEHILANASNWLRIPGQRRTSRPSPYRVPTPHPSHKREEPENDEEWVEEDGDEGVCHSDRVHSYAARQPAPLQRSGGRRTRHPLYRRHVQDSTGSEDNPNTPENIAQRYSQLTINSNEKVDGPTPAEEIQAIVRNVQQRRQVVVIQPIFPFPNYSSGEIVDDRVTNRSRRNHRPTAANNTHQNTATNSCLHYLNRSQRPNVNLDVLFPEYSLSQPGAETTNHSQQCPACQSSDEEFPLPPGYSSDSNEDQFEEPPIFSLPPPALDLSSANLTGSLFHHGPGAPPGGFFQLSSENENGTAQRGGEDSREYARVNGLANMQSRNDKGRRQEDERVTFEHAEDARA